MVKCYQPQISFEDANVTHPQNPFEINRFIEVIKPANLMIGKIWHRHVCHLCQYFSLARGNKKAPDGFARGFENCHSYQSNA
jgi:hypothetical protein